MHLPRVCEPAGLKGGPQVKHACRTTLCTRRRVHVNYSSRKQESWPILGASLVLSGSVWAADAHADVQSSWAGPNSSETQVAQAPVEVQQSQQLPAAPPTAAGSSTTTPFDVILLSIVRVTDDLSLAADGLVELTAAAAAATDPAAAGSTLEPDSFTLSSSSSSVAWQPLPVLHSAAAPALATGADDLGGQGTAQHSMSQQALTVAAEALRLATLLEGESDGCDPSEQELLQQIAAAARLVSIMAVDIIQPAGAQDAADPAASDPSSSNSVVAGEAAADAGSGAGVASFAGLAALGVRVSDLACAGPGADLAAGAPLPCLHL